MKSAPKIEKLVEATNLCDLLDDEKIAAIGREAQDGYHRDRESRKQWESRNAEAMKLALQVMEAKTFPWPGASNVKFPLITVAAMQYAARAYPSLVSGTDLVKAKVYGQDPDGSKAQIAQRVSEHMSWQNLEQDASWEEEQDKLLLVQAIAGCAFKKRTFDPAKGQQCARLVLPDNLIVNYYCRDLTTAPRYTETFYLWSNDLHQRVLDGRFRDLELQAPPNADAQQSDELVLAKDERQGIERQSADSATPYFTGEQYCWYDFDEDGYAEPYIVTFDIDSGKVHRIVARYLPSGIKKRDGKVYCIEPVEIFTKYPFIPSPDGGFYDLGLGALLGPINESVNTSLNQMFDAATMATMGGGFLGRGFKSKSGPFTFEPNKWFPVDAPGDDLRKSIMPLPVRDPPAILFQLVGFLVSYAERVVSSTDLQMGENIGQNTPAETARTMDENGRRVYNAIYKRTWRAMRNEFCVQATLNKLYLTADPDYSTLDGMIRIEDYRAMGLTVKPAADPHVVSDSMRVQQAQMLVQNAMSLPGHNRYQAILRLYKAMQIPAIEEILPQPMTQGPDGKPVPAGDFQPGPDPKMMEIQIKQAAQQLDQMKFQFDQQKIKVELQLEIEQSIANAKLMEAQVSKILAEAKGADVDPLIKLIYASIESEGKKQERLLAIADMINTRMMNKEKLNGTNGTGGAGVEGVAAASANQGVPALAAPVGAGNPGGMVQ